MIPLVVPHDPKWKNLFLQERDTLREALGTQRIAIHHIGSTSIPNILAKPIIDILIEVASLNNLDHKNTTMQTLGYEVMGEYGIETRRYFRKSNSNGIRTHHIHAYEFCSPHILRHLAFRDFLLAHPSKSVEYSQLKADLLARGNISMKTYIDGKDAFVKQTEAKALAWSQTIE